MNPKIPANVIAIRFAVDGSKPASTEALKNVKSIAKPTEPTRKNPTTSLGVRLVDLSIGSNANRLGGPSDLISLLC